MVPNRLDTAYFYVLTIFTCVSIHTLIHTYAPMHTYTSIYSTYTYSILRMHLHIHALIICTQTQTHILCMCVYAHQNMLITGSGHLFSNIVINLLEESSLMLPSDKLFPIILNPPVLKHFFHIPYFVSHLLHKLHLLNYIFPFY